MVMCCFTTRKVLGGDAWLAKLAAAAHALSRPKPVSGLAGGSPASVAGDAAEALLAAQRGGQARSGSGDWTWVSRPWMC